MPRYLLSRRRARKLAGLVLSALLMFAALPAPIHVVAVRAEESQAVAQDPASIPSIPPGEAYVQRNLVSDVPGVGLIEDPLLVNPWGISFAPTGPFWIANAGTSTSTLYRGDVGGSPLVIVPTLPFIRIPGQLPTGTVANSTNSFVITQGSASGPARFIFASLTGNITGWNPGVPAAGSRDAIIVRSVPGAAYTGLAIGSSGPYNFIYAANVGQNRIDVFDSTFTNVSALLPGQFVDPTIPSDYFPFNIQNLGGKLYVAYAKVDPMTGLDIKGFGAVSEFNTDGTFVRRIATDGPLSAPWGLAIAPASFGLYSNALLVGNFDFPGRINAYDKTTGAHLGTLVGESGAPIEIDGLWAITPGNGGQAGDPNTLYFTAGIAHEEHGLFGSLAPTTATATSLIQFSTDDIAISEGAGHIDITVTRSGDVSGAATVNYATMDQNGDGYASQKSDYEIATGAVRFGPGETSKTFRILIVDDNRDEGGEASNEEIVHLVLSNPTGASLGSPNLAQLRILDNDATNGTTNPIDEAQFFVRQHYLDFFNREPDAEGLNFWTSQITSCGSDPVCIETKRINVSAAFFLSTEFQRTGFTVYRAHKAAFGGLPRYGQFMRDTRSIGDGIIVGQGNWEERLEANTQRFFDELTTRPEFVARYGSLSNLAYVDALLLNAGLPQTTGQLYITRLDGSQEVPPRSTPATGVGILHQDPADTSRAFVSLSFSNLTSAQTGAHIHTGPAGTNGPITFPLPNGQFRDFQITMTQQQRIDLGSGNLYINVHTTMFPGGEIRGQFSSTRFWRDVLFNALNDGIITRAEVLRIITDDESYKRQERNAAFVLMQYFGYLRRNPNDPPDSDLSGYNFWLGKLNSFGGDFIKAEMVKAFITSDEYRGRFAPGTSSSF